LGATDDYPVVAVAYVFVVIVCKQIAEPELASRRNVFLALVTLGVELISNNTFRDNGLDGSDRIPQWTAHDDATLPWELVSHPHQIDQRSGLHLVHKVTTVNLYREFADLEPRGNLLVRTASNNFKHDLPLARRQQRKAVA
jgi:hypothetical protein